MAAFSLGLVLCLALFNLCQAEDSPTQELRETLASVPLKSTLQATVDGVDSLAKDNIKACKASACKQADKDFERKKTLALATANDIDEISIAGNNLKEKLENGMESVVNMWEKVEKISVRLNNALKALAPNYLDRMRQASAKLGNETRAKIKTWSVSGAKSEFKKVGAEGLDKAISALSSSLQGPVIDSAKKLFTASQLHSAFQKSSVESQMISDVDVKDVLGMTEDVLKKDMRDSAVAKYFAWTSGTDEAYAYMDLSKEFLDVVAEAVDGFNELSATTSDSELASKAQAAVQKFDSAMEKEKESKAMIEAFKAKVETYFNGQYQKLARSKNLKQAVTAVLSVVQGLSGDVSSAASKINNYVNGIGGASDPAAMESLLAGAAEGLETIDSALDCYERAFKMVGQAIAKCKAGGNNINHIYTTVLSEAAMDDANCQAVVGLGVPSKNDVKGIVSKAAGSLGFNSNCEANRRDQASDAGAGDIEGEESTLSSSQKMTVCNLRDKHSKTNAQIRDLMEVLESQIALVKCDGEGNIA
ncbi:uncharacterized protein LOC116604766 [Nematostella vectensis]|uniref:uncharacterized protein LOC116604766 n=1 Tax=Nematostella vectensis TaxID=45351 RepID=UPI0020775249|nr:uncharacterized protein LOC116604766 [Nematostella vectensis]